MTVPLVIFSSLTVNEISFAVPRIDGIVDGVGSLTYLRIEPSGLAEHEDDKDHGDRSRL